MLSWLMVHMCKRIMSPSGFYIFSKFWFSGSIVWQKSKKLPEMIRNYVCRTPYLSKHTSYDRVFFCTRLKWWHLQIAFFRLSGGEGVKTAKSGPKWQKVLSHSVSQELYLIWLWVLVHMCKMMISPAIFLLFLKRLIFRVFQSSSINTKRKFWGVPHLPHMCVIFSKTLL